MALVAVVVDDGNEEVGEALAHPSGREPPQAVRQDAVPGVGGDDVVLVGARGPTRRPPRRWRGRCHPPSRGGARGTSVWCRCRSRDHPRGAGPPQRLPTSRPARPWADPSDRRQSGGGAARAWRCWQRWRASPIPHTRVYGIGYFAGMKGPLARDNRHLTCELPLSVITPQEVPLPPELLEGTRNRNDARRGVREAGHVADLG